MDVLLLIRPDGSPRAAELADAVDDLLARRLLAVPGLERRRCAPGEVPTARELSARDHVLRLDLGGGVGERTSACEFVRRWPADTATPPAVTAEEVFVVLVGDLRRIGLLAPRG